MNVTIATMQDDIKILEKEQIPKQLLEIPESPKKLYYRGELPSNKSKLLCIVGPRKYSNYGKDVCEELIAGLAGYDITVVSGLALGTDATAHKSAIKAGLNTIAFPGSGLNDSVIYPATNFGLAKEILAFGGALISEFEPDFRATTWSFPKRNRLMAGFCDATLIIEATERSGTLITARLALDYNRNLLVVPNSIFADTALGSNKLIRAGAMPVLSSDDILNELGLDPSEQVLDTKGLTSQLDCSQEEKTVLDVLGEPLSRDELVRKLNLEISKANQLLIIMEIKGLIKEVAGLIHRK